MLKKTNKNQNVFLRFKTAFFVFTLFLCLSGGAFSQVKYKSYNWLYGSDGKLIADTSYHIDDRISECVSSEAELSWHLASRVDILNRLNPRVDMIEMGCAPKFILKINYIKNNDSNYLVDKISLVGPYQLDSSLVPYFKNLFNDFFPRQHCIEDNYFFHIPIKFEFTIVANKEDIGIEKVMENGDPKEI